MWGMFHVGDVQHVGMLNMFVDRFYIALFSALEQTHSTLVACHSK